MEALNLDLGGTDQFLDPDAQRLLENEHTPVQVREDIARHSYNNITVVQESELAERLRDLNYMPEYLFESDRRRNYWAPAFRSPAFAGNKNALLRRATEVIFESTWAHIIANHPEGRKLARMDPMALLMENTTTSDIDPHITTTLKVVRRLVPQLLYSMLINVIPTRQPDTKVPFLKRIYDTTVPGGATSGNEVHPYSGSNYDEYFAGARIYGEEVGTGNAATTDFDLGRSPTYDHEIFLDGVKQTLTTNYSITTGGGTGGVDLLVFVAAPGAAVAITANYDSSSEGVAGNKVRVKMDLLDVSAEMLPLSHIWSLKAEQDMAAYYQMSMLAMNPQLLAEEIYQTIDSVVMQQILREATGGAAIFDSTGYDALDDSAAKRAYDKNIWKKMVAASQDLFETHRQWPSYFACGVGVAERLQSLDEFTAAPQNITGSPQNSDHLQGQIRTFLGTIGNRWKIYQNPKLPTEQGFFGWRPSSPFRTNFVMTMFLPLYISPVIHNDSHNRERGQYAVSRFGRKMIDSTQFSTLTVTT